MIFSWIGVRQGSRMGIKIQHGCSFLCIYILIFLKRKLILTIKLVHKTCFFSIRLKNNNRGIIKAAAQISCIFVHPRPSQPTAGSATVHLSLNHDFGVKCRLAGFRNRVQCSLGLEGGVPKPRTLPPPQVSIAEL